MKSLGEFTNYLVAQLQDQDINFNLRNKRKIHEFFYFLKTETHEKPSFIDRLCFDWDNSYPKSPKLADHINALHGFVCVPNYEGLLKLDEEVAKRWQEQAKSLDSDYLIHAVSLAKEYFS